VSMNDLISVVCSAHKQASIDPWRASIQNPLAAHEQIPFIIRASSNLRKATARQAFLRHLSRLPAREDFPSSLSTRRSFTRRRMSIRLPRRSLGVGGCLKTKTPGGFLLPALISLWGQSCFSTVLLRLEISLNVRTINRRHSDHIASIRWFWCLPVLDELVASSVIPQGGSPCIRKIPHWVFYAAYAIAFGNLDGPIHDVGDTRSFHIEAVINIKLQRYGRATLDGIDYTNWDHVDRLVKARDVPWAQGSGNRLAHSA